MNGKNRDSCDVSHSYLLFIQMLTSTHKNDIKICVVVENMGVI